MFGGQHRVDEVTRTEPVGWTGKKQPENCGAALTEKQARLCAGRCVCERNKKKSQTLLTSPTSLEMSRTISIWIGIILVTLLSVVSDCPTNRPLIVLGPALVANSLFPRQEKHTMQKPDV